MFTTWRPVRSAYTQFGAANDKPVIGDYDGDTKADLAVFRPSNGTWYMQRSLLGFTAAQFGDSQDKPVAADYDGDAKTDMQFIARQTAAGI